jgi:hypothetical protein
MTFAAKPQRIAVIMSMTLIPYAKGLLLAGQDSKNSGSCPLTSSEQSTLLTLTANKLVKVATKNASMILPHEYVLDRKSRKEFLQEELYISIKYLLFLNFSKV